MGTLSLPSILLLSAVGITPIEDVPCDRIDLIEVNHFHDDQGRLVFDQVIFYEWSQEKGRHQVQAWRLLKNASQKPRRDFQTGEYVATWLDGETLREVRAPTIRESWTQYDPELVEREHLPKEKRKDLTKVVTPAPRRPKGAEPVGATEIAKK
jgi:hypothetical protein